MQLDGAHDRTVTIVRKVNQTRPTCDLPINLQDLWISDADAEMPHNRFRTVTIDGHGSPITHPD